MSRGHINTTHKVPYLTSMSLINNQHLDCTRLADLPSERTGPQKEVENILIPEDPSSSDDFGQLSIRNLGVGVYPPYRGHLYDTLINGALDEKTSLHHFPGHFHWERLIFHRLPQALYIECRLFRVS